MRTSFNVKSCSVILAASLLVQTLSIPTQSDPRPTSASETATTVSAIPGAQLFFSPWRYLSHAPRDKKFNRKISQRRWKPKKSLISLKRNAALAGLLIGAIALPYLVKARDVPVTGQTADEHQIRMFDDFLSRQQSDLEKKSRKHPENPEFITAIGSIRDEGLKSMRVIPGDLSQTSPVIAQVQYIVVYASNGGIMVSFGLITNPALFGALIDNKYSLSQIMAATTMIKEGQQIHHIQGNQAFYSKLGQLLKQWDHGKNEDEEIIKQLAYHQIEQEAQGYRLALRYLDSQKITSSVLRMWLPMIKDPNIILNVRRFIKLMTAVEKTKGDAFEKALKHDILENEIRATMPVLYLQTKKLINRIGDDFLINTNSVLTRTDKPQSDRILAGAA